MMGRLLELAGLGGIKERYTTGEAMWMTGLSLAIGLLLGAVTILALVR
jgi:hypothetical protein